MQKYPLIRTIYLYLFSLLGLVLITIGGVRFVDMGLKAFVFTKAEEEERLLYNQPPRPYPLTIPTDIERLQEKEELSLQEKEALRQWLQDYNDWEERRSKIDPITSRRHRDASFNLALMLIGLPLYLYHRSVIKRATSS